ncbi:hypothetical protein K438DRAFT_1837748 [Mycena galopus ATCC 62051]|nr:hypothetical protein K438DRAFT_1837748 [Mycena galopus ATCC 62051]
MPAARHYATTRGDASSRPYHTESRHRPSNHTLGRHPPARHAHACPWRGAPLHSVLEPTPPAVHVPLRCRPHEHEHATRAHRAASTPPQYVVFGNEKGAPRDHHRECTRRSPYRHNTTRREQHAPPPTTPTQGLPHPRRSSLTRAPSPSFRPCRGPHRVSTPWGTTSIHPLLPTPTATRCAARSPPKMRRTRIHPNAKDPHTNRRKRREEDARFETIEKAAQAKSR